MDQLRFASLDYAAKKKRTSGMCLAEMAAVVPWVALEALVERHYPKTDANGGRRPFPLALMTVTRSRWPHALIRRTQKPVSSL